MNIITYAKNERLRSPLLPPEKVFGSEMCFLFAVLLDAIFPPYGLTEYAVNQIPAM